MNWTALLSGLVGGVVGAAASIFVAMINAHTERKQQLLRRAVDAAIEDFRVSESGKDGPVFPMSSYIYHHVRFIELAEKGNLTEEAIRQLLTDRERLLRIYRTAPEEEDKFMPE